MTIILAVILYRISISTTGTISLLLITCTNFSDFSECTENLCMLSLNNYSLENNLSNKK